jgi:hypothetical protein
MKFTHDEKLPFFNYSPGSARAFKNWNHLSSRRLYFKRRLAASQETQSEWRVWLSSLLEAFPNDSILNCNKAMWRLYPHSILTWVKMSADNISTYIDGDEKDRIKVLATVTANRIKWPLCFLATGKAPRVETSQFRTLRPHWPNHSPSGWKTSDIFQGYLECPRHAIPVSHRVHLLWDMYVSHRTDNVRQLAQFLNIESHSIPAGATDKLQPLDRILFRALKSQARRLFTCRCPTLAVAFISE